MTHYETLGVPQTASQDEIKAAYRKLASKCHPDKGGDTKRFQEIQQAYSNIETPEKRAQYDHQLQGGHPGFHFHHHGNRGTPGDIFENFFQAHFGGFNPFTQQHNKQPGNRDVRVSIRMNLIDTLTEQNKTLNVTFPGNKNETVEITIPRGVHDGMVIRYPGLGDYSNPNAPRADLLVNSYVTPHPSFQQSGIDLITTLTINAFDAIIGCEREVNSIDGKIYVINIPRGAQVGTKFGIPNEGLYSMNTPHRGRLIINLEITIPTKLTDQQIEIINSLNKEIT
jgi:curved DNA-binding protein